MHLLKYRSSYPSYQVLKTGVWLGIYFKIDVLVGCTYEVYSEGEGGGWLNSDQRIAWIWNRKGEGGGPKSSKFSKRHLYIAPYGKFFKYQLIERPEEALMTIF